MIIFAHRGYSEKYPENTMLAFKKAIEAGAGGIETDVHLTKDGEIVITHDETLERVSNGKGMVKDYTYEELLKFDFGEKKSAEFKGERAPKLIDLIKLIKETELGLNIEIKVGFPLYPGIEKKVLDMIIEEDILDRVIISSFNHYSLALLRDLNKEVKIAPLYVSALYKPYNYAKSLGANIIHPNYKVINKDVIEECHENGVKVNMYTINDLELAKNLMAIGADGIMTDNPELMVNNLKDVRSGN